MNAATLLDKEINAYLPLLNEQQKKAVLTVVKTFVEETGTEYAEGFKKELDSRYEDYKNGGVLIGEEEAKKRIKQMVNGKQKK
jgi:hypothetical protein